ncbi:hypothetical protein [Methylobrevis pamukkalensis]|uniref:Uncharacterized protein n=1 Tax=Methylobrevis pamukkalensis TaxID=1439726 RepID=A0A1E3GX67_9HYPH|nr:hypothetical protein [Methylobrevis pamukkalensis]ODN68669.1 hypothetical protein A6302_04024 [Methylobrevis pamukkalensis]
MNAVRTDLAHIAIDLGDEPPLRTRDARNAPPDRHRISIRWLTSTVLAALASTCLMSGALYAALDGRPSVVRAGTAPLALAPAAAAPGNVAKADFPLSGEDASETRRILRLGTISRDGERDIIRMRPFARVTTPLVTSGDAVVDDIPAFDPLRIFAEANASTADTAMNDTLYGADVESEMVVKVVDFPVDDRTLAAVTPMPEAATEAMVREQARFLTGATVEVAALPLVDPSRFDFGFAERNSLDELGVRIIPENVSFVPKTDDLPERSDYREEKLIDVQRGDTLESLLIDNEATDDEALEIDSTFRDDFSIAGVAPGEKLRIALGPANDGTGRYQPVSVSIYRGTEHVATVALSDQQAYVPAQEPAAAPALADGGRPTAAAKRPRLYPSLYQTALANDVSPRLIDDLVHVISYDVDFTRGSIRAIRWTCSIRCPKTGSRRRTPRRSSMWASPSAARSGATTASATRTTAPSTTMTRPARTRRSS